MKLTEAEASMLAQSLLRQMRVRGAAMRIEASSAFGVPVLPVLGKSPKALSAAIRIIFTGKPEMEAVKFTAAEMLEGFGVLTGLAKTWSAFLESPSAQTLEMEEKYAVAGAIRTQVRKDSAVPLKKLRRLDRKFESAHLKPALRAAYMRGQGVAAASMVDEDGELRDNSPIRHDICYFIWLYWPDIHHLNSITQLEKFFREMRQDGVTKKNLEKVCREIGLKFKSRGRPKNLFRRKVK